MSVVLNLSESNQPSAFPQREGEPTDEACIPNISLPERRKRLIGGVIQLGITLAILAALIANGVDRWWRLPLGLLFWAAASGFFQWRDQT